MDAEREVFEAWARTERINLTRTPEGGYAFNGRVAWGAWQAGRAALLAAPVAIQGEAAKPDAEITAPGLVFMVAYGDSREVRGLFDTPAQAHAFTQRLKDAMKFGHDEPVHLQGETK